jgi:hypothetical protein
MSVESKDPRVATNTPITDDALRQAVVAAQRRVDNEQDRLRQAEEQLRTAERELALLSELGRLRGLDEMPGGNGAGAAEGDASRQAQLNLTRPSMAHRATSTRRDALVQTVIDLLREHGEPMPIRNLMAELVSRGAPIPGRGEQANLISVITRVPEIVRPHRGVYGLREWNLDGVPVTATRRPARTRKAGR